ncbi:MAG: thiolase family protein [Chloroflexi bacterium]|nr:thiolase family protein [Chloroflexota bacterium]
MSLRGETAIVGIGEIPTQRTYPGRTTYSLCTEATRLAIADAGLRKEDIDGLITRGSDISPMDLAEYMGLHVSFCEGITQHGSSGAHSVALAASVISSGLANTVLCVLGGARDPSSSGSGAPQNQPPASKLTEFEVPYGPVAGMNGPYGLMKQRHMYEYGTTQEQFAKMAVNQRFNALKNPNAVFKDQPITVDDVLNSRFVNEPLHLLESVMPCGGAAACIVTTAERAKSLPNPPVYILGAAAGVTDHDILSQSPDITTTPVVTSARKAYEMAGYGPKDMEYAQFYD